LLNGSAHPAFGTARDDRRVELCANVAECLAEHLNEPRAEAGISTSGCEHLLCRAVDSLGECAVFQETDTTSCCKRFPSPIATGSAKSFCVRRRTKRTKPIVRVRPFAR